SDKVTQGCEKWVDIVRHPRFADAADALHRRGFALYAAVPGAGIPLAELDVARPAALVFGNEHAGLTGAAQAACDGTFTIPMTGFTRSFHLRGPVAIAVHSASVRRRAALGAHGALPAEERARLRARWYVLSVDPRAAQGIVTRFVANRTRRGVGDLPR